MTITPNFIEIYDDVLSEEQCKQIITEFELDKINQEAGRCGDGVVETIKKSTDIVHDIDDGSLTSSIISSALSKPLERYKKKYPEIDKHLQRWAINENVSLMKYEPNQYYHYVHCENDGPKRYPKRVFAWMIFLNNIKKGGGTKFIYQKTTIKAVEGDFYMWPAYWSHFHTGVNAPKETKYILTGWCSYL